MTSILSRELPLAQGRVIQEPHNHSQVPSSNRSTHEHDAGADDILEPQNYSRGGESARAAQVAHSSEQTAHAQACLRDTSCPFWLHPAQRRLQRRDLTRAQPTNKCIEARGHSLGRAPTHTLDFALAVALALTSSPSRSHDSFSSSPSLSLSQWTTRVCTYVHAKHIHDTQ